MALEMRRRVKGQLKKLGGMAFYDVNSLTLIMRRLRSIMFSCRSRGKSCSLKVCAIRDNVIQQYFVAKPE